MAYNRLVTAPTIVKLSAFGYPGWEADNEGNVFYEGALIKGFTTNGRVYVKAAGMGKIKRAQIVCTAWNGPKPDGYGALHKNDVKSDDRPSNLYWGTDSDNRRDCIANGIHKGGQLCDSDIAEIKALYASKTWTQIDLAYIYGVSNATICASNSCPL